MRIESVTGVTEIWVYLPISPSLNLALYRRSENDQEFYENPFGVPEWRIRFLREKTRTCASLLGEQGTKGTMLLYVANFRVTGYHFLPLAIIRIRFEKPILISDLNASELFDLLDGFPLKQCIGPLLSDATLTTCSYCVHRFFPLEYFELDFPNHYSVVDTSTATKFVLIEGIGHFQVSPFFGLFTGESIYDDHHLWELYKWALKLPQEPTKWFRPAHPKLIFFVLGSESESSISSSTTTFELSEPVHSVFYHGSDDEPVLGFTKIQSKPYAAVFEERTYSMGLSFWSGLMNETQELMPRLMALQSSFCCLHKLKLLKYCIEFASDSFDGLTRRNEEEPIAGETKIERLEQIEAGVEAVVFAFAHRMENRLAITPNYFPGMKQFVTDLSTKFQQLFTEIDLKRSKLKEDIRRERQRLQFKYGKDHDTRNSAGYGPC